MGGLDTIGMWFNSSFYTASIASSSVDVVNTNYSGIFHAMFLDLSLSDSLNEWATEMTYNFPLQSTFLRINPQMWYGDCYFAILMTYQLATTRQLEERQLALDALRGSSYSFTDHRYGDDTSICLD
ncbi:hypothetical protein ADUPG1_012352 [Aduncisulcus paluster]|uniref:Uncharacterized protein n=1 Tax=Aduncisulcus paluster TaxID=2918883 RepID=A0ABQ5JZ69_9EUKA|nr:hypothetical protein ADUPG1_012352 [Aduncisulcus paluster]